MKMNERMQRELEYIKRNLKTTPQNRRDDVTTFKAWEDHQITAKMMYDQFVHNNKLARAMVSVDTVCYFAERLGYIGRNDYCGKEIGEKKNG